MVMDHKALEKIRRKPYFENNRINRWIRIQEFCFEVICNKGEELVIPGILCRIYESKDKKKGRRKAKPRREGQVEKVK